MRKIFVLLMLLVMTTSFIGCTGENNLDEQENLDKEATVEDTEKETDSELEVDTEKETEEEADTETETEEDVEAETGIEEDADTEAETEEEADTETETEADVEAETETEEDADTDTETEADADTDTETEIDEDSKMSLEEIISEMYALSGLEMPMTGFVPLTKENQAYMLGTDTFDFIEGVVSEPMMGSFAHSVVMFRVDETADVENIKAAVKENVDPVKWICVSVEEENVIVENFDHVIVLIMEERSATFFEALKSIMGS